jgi:hypothetical protein
LLVIDDTEWAVEHMRIVYDSNMVPAQNEAESAMRQRLEALAYEHKVGLSVALTAPRWATGKSTPLDFYDSVVGLAVQAITSGTSRVSLTCQVHLVPGHRGVDFTFFPASNPMVLSQVIDGMRAPLLKKLARQLRNAKALGYPVLLLLDQMDDPTQAAQAQWIAHPKTVADALEQVLAEASASVDEAWLRDAFGNFHHLQSPSLLQRYPS